MALFKRFELWLLLILIGGGLYYVLQQQAPKLDSRRAPLSQTQNQPATKQTPQNKPRFLLKKSSITRDGDHFIVQIDMQCQRNNDKALLLQTPHTQLLASGAREMEVFFLPFQPKPSIEEAKGKIFTLRYWLTQDDLKSPLTLKIGSTELSVKSSQFEPQNLPNKQSKTFTTNQWR